VIVVDVNLLLYAVNADAPQNPRARRWWEGTLAGTEAVGLAWTVALGFLRLVTSARVLPRPLEASRAVAVLDDWLTDSPVRFVEPTERHWPILRELVGDLGTAGNLTTDAHLAALAIEHGATLCSTDNDFARFPNLRWRNPLA
jgi:toxin-antitoxin system PIN domain toxin